MVEIRNPTVEILEQGESDNEDILGEEVIKSSETWTKYYSPSIPFHSQIYFLEQEIVLNEESGLVI